MSKTTKTPKAKPTKLSEQVLYPASPLEQATNAFKARVKSRNEDSEYVADFLNILETRILPAMRSFTYLDLLQATQSQGREIPRSVLASLLSAWADTMQRLNKVTILPPLVYDYETYVCN